MIFRDVMTVLESADKVRILQDNKEVYEGYFANMRVNTEILNQFGNMEVKRYRLNPEIRQKSGKNEISCLRCIRTRRRTLVSAICN